MTALPAPAAPGWPWPADYAPTLAEIDAVCPEYANAWRRLSEKVIRRELGLGPEWIIEDLKREHVNSPDKGAICAG